MPRRPSAPARSGSGTGAARPGNRTPCRRPGTTRRRRTGHHRRTPPARSPSTFWRRVTTARERAPPHHLHELPPLRPGHRRQLAVRGRLPPASPPHTTAHPLRASALDGAAPVPGVRHEPGMRAPPLLRARALPGVRRRPPVGHLPRSLRLEGSSNLAALISSGQPPAPHRGTGPRGLLPSSCRPLTHVLCGARDPPSPEGRPPPRRGTRS